MRLRVAVIYGGRSGEHEISLRSAKSIMEAMDPDKYKILHFMISKEGKWRPRPIVPEPNGNPEIDVVFPVLHGPFGEDGTIQGLLELADLPYVGSGVLASAVSMDKAYMKVVLAGAGLPVGPYVVVPPRRWVEDLAEVRKQIEELGWPVFVKPARGGSSVGISKVHGAAELDAAITLAQSWDPKVIVEAAIPG